MISKPGAGSPGDWPDHRPLIVAVAVIAVALVGASIFLADLSVALAVLGGMAIVILGILAVRSESVAKSAARSRREEAAAAADMIERLSWQDRATGLFSFNWFQQAVEREVSRSRRYDQPCALVWLSLDIDNLREQSVHVVNTDPAHIWRFVTDLVLASVRNTDTVAVRPGEYSVAILLPQSDVAGGNIVLNRLSTRLEIEKLEISDGTRASARFHNLVVSMPADATTAGELLQAVQR